jgi:hypothetical protein
VLTVITIQSTPVTVPQRSVVATMNDHWFEQSNNIIDRSSVINCLLNIASVFISPFLSRPEDSTETAMIVFMLRNG